MIVLRMLSEVTDGADALHSCPLAFRSG
jgi:hypothetical protein